MKLLFSVLYLFCLLFIQSTGLEQYSEEYHVQTLPNNDLAHVFKFNTIATQDGKPFKLFPLTISQLFGHDIDEIRLSMTTGFWKHEAWGIHKSQIESPTGFLLFVKFSDKLAEEEISKTWSLIVKQVNGFFCSSILEVDPFLTVIPTFVSNSSKYRIAHLSGEPLCTENVKPFLRLLPCKDSGLGKLIFSKEIFNFPYHSLGIHAIRDKNELRLELSAVNVNSKQNLLKQGGQFAQITQLSDNLKCKVARKQEIDAVLSDAYSVVLPSEAQSIRIDIRDVNATGAEKIFSIKLDRDVLKKKTDYEPPFSMTTAQEQSDFRGGIMTTTIVNRLAEDVNAVFFHSIPWQFRITVNELRYQCTSRKGDVTTGVIFKKQMDPALIQKKALTVQFDLKLPKMSRCTLKLPFSNHLMMDMSYPPDSNYGIFVPSPILVVNMSEEHLEKESVSASASVKTSEEKYEILIYGEPLLILLPVPDFSMPFNVFIIATTVAGFFFGSIFNVNTRLYVPKLT